MSDKILKLGLDPGYGSIKAAIVVDDQLQSFILPSVVGVGSTDIGALGLVGFANSRRSDVPRRIVWNSDEYLVGHNVADYARPIERMDLARFVDGPELRALVYCALANLNLSGCQVALSIGLPVELLKNKAQAIATEKEMQGWLIGQHHFDLDGQEIALEIVKARASVAQPLGAWLDWGLSNEGKWQKGNPARTAPALIIDVGFNTLDIFAIENGRPSPRYTDGDALGMRRAAEMIAREHPDLGLHQADDLLQNFLANKPALVHVHGQPHLVAGLIKQSLNSLAAEVIQFVERRVGKAEKFRIILTGGGALALVQRLQRVYPHAELMPSPVLANARGLAKLALTSFLD